MKPNNAVKRTVGYLGPRPVATSNTALERTVDMNGPSYEWICHKCEQINKPRLLECSHCGFPAIASPAEVARAKGEPHPAKGVYRDIGKGLAWFIPLWPF
jgi:hypothetical protein